MSDEEIKLKANFWNSLSVGIFIGGLVIPVILIFQLYEKIAEAPLRSAETYKFCAAMTVAFIAGLVCRAIAVATIKKLPSPGRSLLR